MAATYSVTINNHATYSAYFMLFQNDPGSFAPNAMSLAWFSKYSNPGPTAKLKFTWQIDWGFSWAETGTLAPGVTFEASETAVSSPSANKITLDYNGAYFFGPLQRGPDPARLYIAELPNIPINSQASVGVTMSGSTVYAVQAQANNNLTFSPHPTYYLAYGNYEEGEVIDVSTVTNPLELNYPTGIYAITTTLNADNTWSAPETLAERNARFLEGRKKNSELRWAEL